MIVVENLLKKFGGFRAVDGASLTIEEGTITGLIGPNGAGKTTLFNVIAGNLEPTSGRVTMDGEDITGLPPHELFHKGLLRTFQIAHEFSSMTVRENLMTVPAGQSGELIWNAWIGRKRIAAEERALVKKADEVLEFLASRITRNVRRLEGALIKVGTYSRLIKETVNVRKAEELVHDILQEEIQHQITIERIQRKVTEMYDLRMSDMQNRRRPSHIAFPRQIAMYLSRLLTHHPLKEIGEAFGGRDHGTVIHAVKTVENMMEQDEKVRNTVEYLVRQLRGNRQ
jgi:ABC-type Fe3+/spermidine/putrescine transport system ATPase subunit